MNALSPMITDPIRTFLPGVDDEEHLLRCRLVKAHNIASSRFRLTANPRARELFGLIQEASSDWKFAPASKEHLKDIADALVRLFMAAQSFERLEGPHEG
jgi:hypothetical protein